MNVLPSALPDELELIRNAYASLPVVAAGDRERFESLRADIDALLDAVVTRWRVEDGIPKHRWDAYFEQIAELVEMDRIDESEWD